MKSFFLHKLESPYTGSGDLPLVIAPQLRRTDNILFRCVSQINSKTGAEDITATHGWILCYLNDNRDRDIYQRDVESTFSVTGSTVTNILQRMEKNGYIRRESVTNDARLKKLILTDVGVAAYEKVRHSFQEQNAQLEEILMPEEYEAFLRLLLKIQTGLAQVQQKSTD